MSVTSREYSTQIPTQQAKFLAASLFLCCSTQVQAFSIISYKQSPVPIKAWKESLSSATSENHTWIPSLSSLTCFEMQGRPNSVVCVPADKSYLSLEQFDHLCSYALPIPLSCIPDFPSMLV